MATQENKQGAALTSPGYLIPFFAVTALFFLFGFITNLNMALVPHLRSIFDLTHAWSMLAESAFFLAFFLFSTPAAKLIEAIGYQRTMAAALFLQVAGCLLFLPAARLVSFPLFLAASFVVGAGVTMLQTAVNPYAAILGPESTAPIRLTLAQALNSVGGTLAPLVAGSYILTDAARQAPKAAVANTVRGPYLAIAAALLALGVVVLFLKLPRVQQSQETAASLKTASAGKSVWRRRHTLLGAAAIFVYVGVEVGLASIGVNYFLAQGVDGAKAAGFFAGLGGLGALVTHTMGPWTSVGAASILLSLYWFGALVGRLLGSWLLTWIRAQRLLGLFGLCATLLVLASMFTQGWLAIGSIVLCGFFNSIMFPNIYALGLVGLGAQTGRGAGLLTTAIVGGAVIPYLLGKLADVAGMQNALVLPALGYAFIAYYGVWGSKVKKQGIGNRE